MGYFGIFWGKLGLTQEEQELISRYNQIRNNTSIYPIFPKLERRKVRSECYDLAQIDVDIVDLDVLKVGIAVGKSQDGKAVYEVGVVLDTNTGPVEFCTLEEASSGSLMNSLSEGLKGPDHIRLSAKVPHATLLVSDPKLSAFLTQIS